jgi:hypothetical protein
MKCIDCNGTGGDDSCYLCRGHRIIPVRRALREGYQKDDLDEIYENRCDCPACHADACELCDGSGTITAEDVEREITRVLICGLTGRIPPVLSRHEWPNGRVIIHDHERLLSPGASWICKKRGWSWRLQVLAFGDELHMYPAGKLEAEKRYRIWLSELSEISFGHWLRWMQEGEPHRGHWSPPDQIEPERISQWADDGGCALSSPERNPTT